MSEKKKGLELLREPFPDHQISLLPKPTKNKAEMDKLPKAKCAECGGYHQTSNIIHLSYVGHAALTDRLLDADPLWIWEPLAYKDGLPAFDSSGGLWIKLTVCGHTRIGYGNAEASAYKEVGSREKEVIGDALRNAAMRFGAALELWHKGELHLDDDEEEIKSEAKKEEQKKPAPKEEGKQQTTPFIVIGTPSKIEEINGPLKSGKPSWVRWGITMQNVVYGTFDKKIADSAQAAMDMDVRVSLHYKDDGKYKTIETIEDIA